MSPRKPIRAGARRRPDAGDLERACATLASLRARCNAQRGEVPPRAEPMNHNGERPMEQTYTVHDGPGASGGTPWPGEPGLTGEYPVRERTVAQVLDDVRREAQASGEYRPGDRLTITYLQNDEIEARYTIRVYDEEGGDDAQA